jgi:DNA polymerase-3 subunit beta
MKITLGSGVLDDAVVWTVRTLANRPAVPILGGLMLDAEGDTLTVSAFDYDATRRATVSADVAEPGRVLLPGKLLAQITSSLPGKTTELTLSGQEAELRCGPCEFTLATMPAEDYPALPEPPEPIGQVDVAQLKTAIAQVTPAASLDGTLMMLIAVCFTFDEAGLELAATDRYRIAARRLDWQPTTGDTPDSFLAPAAILRDIGRGLGTGTATIGADDRQLSITCDGRQTTVRLIDEKFINYRAYLETQLPTVATVDAETLTAAVKRVALLLDLHKPVQLHFTADHVAVHAGSGELGRGSETLDCQLDGEAINIAFQPAFLLDGLAGIGHGPARLAMGTPTTRALLTAADNDAYRYLVQPLRIA